MQLRIPSFIDVEQRRDGYPVLLSIDLFLLDEDPPDKGAEVGPGLGEGETVDNHSSYHREWIGDSHRNSNLSIEDTLPLTERIKNETMGKR
jgi:hypothetical protein